MKILKNKSRLTLQGIFQICLGVLIACIESGKIVPWRSKASSKMKTQIEVLF